MFYFSFNFFLVVLFVQVVVEYFLWSPKTPDASLAAAPAIKVRREWGKGDNEIQLIDSNRSYSEVSQVSSQSTKPDSPTHFYHYHALSFFKKTNLWVSYQGTAYLTQNMPKPRSAGTQTQRLCWQSTWPRASKCMGDHGFIWILSQTALSQEAILELIWIEHAAPELPVSSVQNANLLSPKASQ